MLPVYVTSLSQGSGPHTCEREVICTGNMVKFFLIEPVHEIPLGRGGEEERMVDNSNLPCMGLFRTIYLTFLFLKHVLLKRSFVNHVLETAVKS